MKGTPAPAGMVGPPPVISEQNLEMMRKKFEAESIGENIVSEIFLNKARPVREKPFTAFHLRRVDEDGAGETAGQKEGEKEREKEEEVTSPCAEVVAVDVDGDDPFDWVGYSQANSALTVYCSRLPPPPQFGHGNPFLMFLCLACLLEVSNHILIAGTRWST